jgi:GxxExxY protein
MPNQPLIDCSDELTTQVVNAAFAVHKEFGPGLLESVYELAMMLELSKRGIKAERQVEVPVFYHGEPLGVGFRADIIVEGCLLLELKSVERLEDIHMAQIITYLKLLKFKRGYLLNFNCPLMRDGIRRVSI